MARSPTTTFAPFVAELRDGLTTFSMDRRGDGASGDADGYAIEREFEDVAAVAAGELETALLAVLAGIVGLAVGLAVGFAGVVVGVLDGTGLGDGELLGSEALVEIDAVFLFEVPADQG